MSEEGRRAWAEYKAAQDADLARKRQWFADAILRPLMAKAGLPEGGEVAWHEARPDGPACDDQVDTPHIVDGPRATP